MEIEIGVLSKNWILWIRTTTYRSLGRPIRLLRDGFLNFLAGNIEFLGTTVGLYKNQGIKDS